MKKLLLFSVIICFNFTFGQNCFTIGSTGFATGLGVASVSIPSDNFVWAAASTGSTAALPNLITNRTVAVSSNGGVTFTPRNCVLYPVSGNNAKIAISNVCGVTANLGFISAHNDSSAGAPSGGVWRTDDAGVTWTRQNTASFNDGNTSFTNFVHFWDENNGVCMGDPSGGYFEIYTTTNGGVNWVRTSSSNMPIPLQNSILTPEIEFGLTNQFIVTGNTIWFGTTYGRIIKSTNKGLNWTVINTPIAAFSGGIGTNGPQGFSANQDWKNDLVGTITDSDYNYWRTTDGGLTWIPSTSPLPVQNSFKYVPNTLSTVVASGIELDENGASLGPQVKYSYDDGVTWLSCPLAGGAGSLYGTNTLEVRSTNIGFLGGGATSAVVGGIWRLTGPQLPTVEFSSDKLFSISPNPTNGLMKLTGVNIKQVQITDILGKVIANNSYDSLSNVDLNISEYNSGIYLVKVANNEGQTSVVKVVKQ